MTTRTTDNPFGPSAAPSREQLDRYLRGELPPAEQHELERRIEQDQLLRDAVEGLRMPGALTAASALDVLRPYRSGFNGRAWSIIGISLVAVVIALWTAWPNDTEPPAKAAVPVAGPVPAPETPVEHAAFETELHQATALPESLRSAFRGNDRFIQAMDINTPVLREDPPLRVDVLPPTDVEPPPVVEEKPRTVPHPSPSRKLMFFQDLKLVHPSELYPVDPVLELAAGSLDARYSDAQAKADASQVDHAVPYDRYFQVAMSKFARGDRQGCLEDLFLVLDEYPEDLNALFYAGLCCYDLGLFPRAADLLDRARRHRVDTFIEEGEWYHALAVDRAFGRDQALPLLKAVVQRDGFYAGRAREHLAANR